MAPVSLVEREQQLAALDEAFAEPSAGAVVLIAGEAGFGKTSLLSVLVDRLDHRYRMLSTACEPVGIPAGFAPLFELLDDLPADLAADIRSGSGRPAVYAGMLDLIKNDKVVLVIEDLHWGDEATLGLVRYLGRRIGPTGSRLIVTYRPEELAFNSPLRLVIADLGPSAVRMDLAPLSVAGVARLIGGLEMDAEAVHGATLGNPFFVEEIARNPGVELPPNIQNAVLANVGLLPKETLEFISMVALSPDGVGFEHIADLGDERGTHTDLGFQRRLLATHKGRIECRHELIRQSLISSILPATSRRLQRRLLESLEARANASPDTARLAYHAMGADDPEKARSYSLQAARDAASSGAHREAAFHYVNALEHAQGMDAGTLSETLLHAAREHSAINAFDTAVRLARQRLGLAASPQDVGRARAWIAFFEARKNDLLPTRAESEAAAEILRDAEPSPELALAMAVLSWVEVVEGNWHRAVEIGDAAAAIARDTRSVPIEVYAATNAGTARWLLGDRSGIDEVERAARLGIDADGTEFTAKAINNLGAIALSSGDVHGARRWFSQLQDYSASRELDAWYIAAVSTMAWIDVASARYDDADRNLEIVVGQKTCLQTEIETMVVAARLRMRRGDPGAVELIRDVCRELESFADHHMQVMGCVLSMEAAWLGVIPLGEAVELYEQLRLSPVIHDDRPGRAELTFWANRLGVGLPEWEIVGRVGLELSGRPEEASAKWAKSGYPIEALITRAMAAGADLDAVFFELASLGAHGVARGLRHELQRRGVGRVPRGPRAGTVDNPGGLTNREMEVLALLSAGMSNAAIAGDLYISEKTVGHHVSSVLAKLGVSSRGKAAAMAITEGWSIPQNAK